MTVALAAVVLSPSTAFADMGIPMLALVWPASWALLVPVVLAEALLAKRILGLGFGRSLQLGAAANLFSTLVGVPVAWGFALALEFLGTGVLDRSSNAVPGRWLEAILHAAWLGPGTKGWMVYAAGAALCVPLFLVSVWLEHLLVRQLFPDLPADELKWWAWVANGTSYAFIVEVLLIGALVSEGFGSA